jgi:hypothetical protein
MKNEKIKGSNVTLIRIPYISKVKQALRKSIGLIQPAKD